MDHHCTFTDNCVAKLNTKYFMHYTIWSNIAMMYGMGIFWYNVYTTNQEMKIGLQGWYQALTETNPLLVGQIIDFNPELDNYCYFDSFAIVFLSILLAFVTAPLGMTLFNIIHKTDEVLKLKKTPWDGTKLSWAEVYDHIYGKDTSYFEAIFACYY